MESENMDDLEEAVFFRVDNRISNVVDSTASHSVIHLVRVVLGQTVNDAIVGFPNWIDEEYEHFLS